jgi:MtN3 and saliva related transmembrane protein
LDFVLNNIEIFGFMAAALGTVSLVPQVIKMWKTRSVQSISLMMYMIISVDSILWLTYGIALSLTPLIIQSTLTLTCSLSVVVMKILWK